MKKHVSFVSAGLTLALSLLLTLAACSSGGGGGGNPEPVVDLALDGKVTAPARDAQPDTTAINEAQYTGTVAWQTENGQTHSGAFAASTVYKAVVTLTAKNGYTFAGVAANSFTYTGATAIANAANSGTVTITFQATAAPGEDTVVSALALDGLIIAPVRDAQPDTTAINETQYTGTVVWQTENGQTHSGAFAASTVYKAVVTLTAKNGYTFAGVAANSFSCSGAAVANGADSGVVTITFPATAAPGEDTVVSTLALDGKVTAPARGVLPDTTAINEAQYTGTVVWQTENGQTHTGAFAPSTVYKAVVTLTANTGYTFDGVAANSFAYTGATAIANAANSGTVTITFPATAAVVVSAFSLDGKITAPAQGGQPDATPIDTTQYTGTIAWQTAGGASHNGAFAASTVYKALVTLSPKTGYTFSGVEANSFAYTGATAIANAANSGTVTITFPATAAAVVSAFSLDGKITAPARYAQPDATGINTEQYTGTIAWQTADGAPHSGVFAASTVYKALVTLSPKSGYTFDGVAANSFTCTGAAEISHAANSGTVTITFPKTADPDPNTDIAIGAPSVKLYRDNGTVPLAHKGSTEISSGTGIVTVRIDPGTYAEINWYLNGAIASQAQGKTSIAFSKQTTGSYLITVEAVQGGEKQSGAHTFVVK